MRDSNERIFDIYDSISLHKIDKDSKYNFVALIYEINNNTHNTFILVNILSFFLQATLNIFFIFRHPKA